MKKFIAGLVIGVLLTSTGIGLASQDVIRIFIDGQEVVPDVPPQIIDGRVMVPARFIAEPLGATVEWDDESRAVVITKEPLKTSTMTMLDGDGNLRKITFYIIEEAILTDKSDQ